MPFLIFFASIYGLVNKKIAKLELTRKFKFGFNIIQIWIKTHLLHIHISEDMKGESSYCFLLNMTTYTHFT